MSRIIFLRPDAARDIEDAEIWHEDQRSGLGDDFLDCVDEVLERIQQQPELYAAEFKRVRRAPMNRFSYIVYYRLTSDLIDVVGVIHASRSSRAWRDRI